MYSLWSSVPIALPQAVLTIGKREAMGSLGVSLLLLGCVVPVCTHETEYFEDSKVLLLSISAILHHIYFGHSIVKLCLLLPFNFAQYR